MESKYHWELKYKWDEIVNADENLTDWIVGFCRIGNLCFDLTIRDYTDYPTENDPRLFLSYDLYVGGIDKGYGYSKDGYPYNWEGGNDWSLESLKSYNFDEFKLMAEDEFRGFIKLSGCEDEANKPLHIW